LQTRGPYKRDHGQGCQPARNTVNIHNPLTALLGWDNLAVIAS